MRTFNWSSVALDRFCLAKSLEINEPVTVYSMLLSSSKIRRIANRLISRCKEFWSTIIVYMSIFRKVWVWLWGLLFKKPLTRTLQVSKLSESWRNATISKRSQRGGFGGVAELEKKRQYRATDNVREQDAYGMVFDKGEARRRPVSRERRYSRSPKRSSRRDSRSPKRGLHRNRYRDRSDSRSPRREDSYRDRNRERSYNDERRDRPDDDRYRERRRR